MKKSVRHPPKASLLRTLLTSGFLIAAQFLVFCLFLRYSSLFISSGVFFRGLTCAGLSVGTLLLLSHFRFLPRSLLLEDMPDRLVVASLGLMTNVVFLVVLPVTVDRSVTVFLLSVLENQQASSSDEETLSTSLREVYVGQYQAASRRMNEQIGIGNVRELPDGRFELTPQGKRFVALCRAISEFFGLDRRYVEPGKTMGAAE